MRFALATLFIFAAVFFDSIEISSQMRSASRTIYRAIGQIPGIKVPEGTSISFEGRKIAVDQKGSLFPFVQYWQLVFLLEPFNAVEPVSDDDWLKEIARFVERRRLKPTVLRTAQAAVAAVRAAQEDEERDQQQGRLSFDGRRSIDSRKSVDGRRFSISPSSGTSRPFHFSAGNVHQSEVRAVRIRDPLNTVRMPSAMNGADVIAVTPRPNGNKFLQRRSSTSSDNNMKK